MKHVKMGSAQDLLDSMPKERVYNPDRKYTRAQAEKLISEGMDPEPFTKHANYHVRVKAWKKMGKPLPEGDATVNQFLATLQSKDVSKMPAPEQAKYIALLRHRLLGEALPVEETVTPES